MNLIVGILFILLFSVTLWFTMGSKLLTLKAYALILLLKIVFAIFTCIYYGVDDIYMFQQDANRLTTLMFENFSGYKNILLYDDYSFVKYDIRSDLYYWVKPRAFFMAKILSLLNLISGSNIYLNAIILTLFNYLGILYLLQIIKRHSPSYLSAAVIAMCFIPSVIFNTSGLEKEVLVMAGIYAMIGFGIQLYHRKTSLFDALILLLGVFLIYKIKYYYLAVLGPIGAAYLVSHYIDNRYYKYGIALVCVGFLMYYSRYIHPYLSPDLAFQSTIDANHYLVMRSREGMYIPFSFIHYTPVEFLMNSPLALIYGLFGPFIWEVRNYAMLYIGVENLIILVLSIWLVYKLVIKEVKWTYLGTMVLIYIVVLAIILAFYSPNFGTLTRYKVSFLVVMMVFLSHHTFSKWLKKSQIEKFLFDQ